MVGASFGSNVKPIWSKINAGACHSNVKTNVIPKVEDLGSWNLAPALAVPSILCPV